ncbi:MAG: hypothetical protein GXO90_00975 [FCB group bacterium]|nr:hypothetical protein [FCB group bacterium]
MNTQKLRLIYLFVYGSLFIWSCQDITGTIENPFDSSSPNFITPLTDIVSGPGNDVVLDTSRVEYRWRHADPTYWPDSTGNWDISGNVLFTYRVNHTTWSPWMSGKNVLSAGDPNWSFDTTSGIHTLILDNLDDGAYEFEVRCKYPTEIQEVNWPHRSFSVNALVGPALILSPANIYLDSASTFVVNTRLEDVVNLIGVRAHLQWDPLFLTLISYELQSDSTQFFFDSMAEYLQQFTFVDTNPDSGLFDLSIALAGNSVSGTSGSGVLIRMIFQHIGSRGESAIRLLPDSDLRDANNQSMLILTRDARVVVW